MDAFDKHVLIAIPASMLICIPLEIILKRRFKKQGKSIRFLQLKIYTFIGGPIVALPFLLAEDAPWWFRITAFFFVAFGGAVEYFNMVNERKSIRGLFGLSTYDEDVDEVIPEDGKAKQYRQDE